MKIGVLSLQGAFIEHVAMVQKLGVESVQVRTPKELEGCDGLIIPGGESTAITLLMEKSGLWEVLEEWREQQKPIFGTCAGIILLSDRISGEGKQKKMRLIGGLNITSDRNSYGSQTESFATRVKVEKFGGDCPAIFIRAPAVAEVGEGVEILASLERNDKVSPVAVRQGPYLGLTFHPELGGDKRWHQLFLEMCSEAKET